MAYHIKLEAFEGPFDLLFHLIEKNQIDLYDIPINEITAQYIETIYAMETLDLDVTSEFLLMAATLLEIKSKMLLPIETPDSQQLELEEADPRHELIRKLLEYKKYKEAALVLKESESLYSKLFFKPREEILYEPVPQELDVSSLSMETLLLALEELLAKKTFPKTNPTLLQQLKRDDFTVENQINFLLSLLNQKKVLYFQELFQEMRSKNQVITTFLALLELIKLKQVYVKQENSFTQISVEKRTFIKTEVS